MALEVQMEVVPISYAEGIFGVRDTTGTYSISNIGGYGMPNPVRGDFYYRFTATLKTYKNGDFPVLPLSILNPDTGYEKNIQTSFGGMIKVRLYASLIYSPAHFTYRVGEIMWHSTQNAYVRILTTPVNAAATFQLIPDSSIGESEYAFSKEYYYFYSLEIEKKMAAMLTSLPVKECCETDTWMEDFQKVRLDADKINLFVCKGFQNNALQILSKYQKQTYQPVC